MSELTVILLLPGYGSQIDGASQYGELQWQHDKEQLPWQAQLLRLAGLAEETGQSLPVAQFSDFPCSTSSGLVCAAPVHLQADRDTASLIPPQQLDLSEEEATSITAGLNEFLKPDGMELISHSRLQWYMTGLDGQQLRSYPPAFLAHRNVSAFLPAGEGDGQWRRLLTEIQMLLHAHPVNSERERLGKLPVNSLWFWGGSVLGNSIQAGSVRFSA